MARIINFDNSYIKLPERFYQSVNPSPVKNPQLIKFNHSLASELAIHELSNQELTEFFSGNKILKGSQPIAQAYAGHQFGHFVPQLGDGRAILLGEVIDSQGQRKDLQLKGSGRTAFSRAGDGRAWLGPVIREYIVSEAMHALGVPSTRALAAISTGEDIFRETPLPGAILTRIASSHIRIGTFEYFAARNDTEALELLTDYVINRHYPQISSATNKYLALIEAVARAQAKLIAKWMSVGFVHGIMNTDNTSICAETIDYGPCAFIDHYNANAVFSSIDRHGRYAYSNQASICIWNISCLANALLGLISENQDEAIKLATQAVTLFKTSFEQEYKSIFLRKIGLKADTEFSLVLELLALMQEFRADFTLSFRYLTNAQHEEFIRLFEKNDKVKIWLDSWLALEPNLKVMQEINPAYIARNHLIEEAISKAHLENDFSLFHQLNDCLAQPYIEKPKYFELTQAPLNKDSHYITYCGT